MANKIDNKLDNFIGKTAEVIVKEVTLDNDRSSSGVIYIKGYANKFLDDNGNIIVDRSEEAVLPEAYNISSYMKNPVLLYQHNNSDVIGKVINIDIRPNGLYIEAEVHKIMNEKVYYAVENGILKTFSIGFRIKDAQVVDDVYFWTDIELLEVSIVSIPDNQESLFSVLTEAPCGSGVCLLANKAVSAKTIEKSREQKAIKNTEVSETPWSDVNKTELKQKLNELGRESYIKEAFLVVRDPESRSTWKFPHHELRGEDLVLNRGGVISAYAALKGARNEPNITPQEKKEAAAHLLKHYNVLKEQGYVDEVPEDLIDMMKEFEDLCKKSVDEKQTNVKTNSDEQLNEEETISTNENNNQEIENTSNEPSNASQEGSGIDSNAQPEGTAEETGSASEETQEVSAEAIKNFIENAKSTTEGLDELLALYLQIEEALNSALTQKN